MALDVNYHMVGEEHWRMQDFLKDAPTSGAPTYYCTKMKTKNTPGHLQDPPLTGLSVSNTKPSKVPRNR